MKVVRNGIGKPLSQAKRATTMPVQVHAISGTEERQKAEGYVGAYEQLDYLVGELRSPSAQRMTHSEVEELIKTQGWELIRRLLQAHMDERSKAEVNEAVVGGTGNSGRTNGGRNGNWKASSGQSK